MHLMNADTVSLAEPLFHEDEKQIQTFLTMFNEAIVTICCQIDHLLEYVKRIRETHTTALCNRNNENIVSNYKMFWSGFIV